LKKIIISQGEVAGEKSLPAQTRYKGEIDLATFILFLPHLSFLL
jgi:hypothetical protein